MLARTFLTAKQLGVSEVDRKAAIEVLELLEGGQLKYMDGIQQLCCNFGGLEHVEESPPPFPNSFNMAFWSHCIGGWMEIAKGRMLSLRTQSDGRICSNRNARISSTSPNASRRRDARAHCTRS
jgi:hypothetical protein